MKVKTTVRYTYSTHQNGKNEKVYVAYFDLEDVTVDFDYHMVWAMRGIDICNVKDLSKEKIIKYLKEALVGYGVYGKIGVSTAKIGFEF